VGVSNVNVKISGT